MIKNILIGIGAFIAFMLVMFLLNVGGMYSKSFFGKWNEQIRTEIQKESQAHQDGLNRNLSQLMIQHSGATASGKVGIRSVVLHQYSQADTTGYPEHLQTFLKEMGL